VVSKESAHEAVNKKINEVLQCGPLAVADAKRLCLDELLSTSESAARLAEARSRKEAKEGTQAFLERRPAPFVTTSEVGGQI
ncbi:MAG: hypothetical protein ACRDF4_04020, partial [Rhabdochlamydiaceae bacterium]